MLKIDIVCPVFREEASIEAFHNALLAATTPLADEYEFRYIYTVDPSPPDRSGEILRAIADRSDNVTVIEMSRRFGHQAAIIAGIDEAKGDAVVMLDSDLQHPPSLIPTLIKHWREGAEIVQTLRQDGANISFGKRVTSRMFYSLFESVTKIDLNSGAADFRLLSRKVANVFRDQIREHNPFFRGLMTWVGYRIAYVPFVPDKRFAGRPSETRLKRRLVRKASPSPANMRVGSSFSRLKWKTPAVNGNSPGRFSRMRQRRSSPWSSNRGRATFGIRVPESEVLVSAVRDSLPRTFTTCSSPE